MLNERTRKWTDTKEGKRIQCEVFAKLAELVALADEGAYKWFGRDYLNSKLKRINTQNCKVESVHGGTFNINETDCFIYALDRLEEHGLIKLERHSHGEDVRIMKKGWERYNKNQVTKHCLHCGEETEMNICFDRLGVAPICHSCRSK